MKIVIATGNKHKVVEISAILAPYGIDVVGAGDVGGMPEVVEDGVTFEQNAVKKAVECARALKLTVLADDSGLEVEALGGAPGVYSARYAGEGGNDGRNVRKLLANLSGVENRRARFTTVLALATPDGVVKTADGHVSGAICDAPRGEGGFGYDPVFIPDGFDMTFGELPAEIKNSLSHRANALKNALAQGLFSGLVDAGGMALNRGSFDENREALEHQYDSMRRNPDVQVQINRLAEETQAMYENRGDAPAIRNRADIFCHVLAHAPVEVQAFDMFADHIMAGNAIGCILGRRRGDNPPAFDAETAARVQAYADEQIFHAQLDLSHTSPDWRRILELGPAGLKTAAEKALATAADDEAREFYGAVAQVYGAVSGLMERFAAAADATGADDVAACLRKIAVAPPETLREALQLSLVYNVCQEIEGELVRSQGPFDRLFIGFYRHDIENGILTREHAKELLKYFWTKFYAQGFSAGKNIGFAGCLADGTDACNELTELCFEIHRELGRINPKLSFRVFEGTSDARLRQAAACVRDGKTSIVFSNDGAIMEAMRRHGKTVADASEYILIGCYEPAVHGKEMCCSMAGFGNIVPPLEAALNNGRTFSGVRIGPDGALPQNFNELKAAYYRQLDALLAKVLEDARVYEKTWPQVNPSPLLSGSMAACIESGRDVSAGGTAYNSSGVMCAGFGTVVDSLLAARMLVDERKLCTMAELRDILKAGWEGHEHLRQLALARAPKWGNGIKDADELGAEVFEHLQADINNQRNARGGWFQLGLWSIDNNIRFGKKTPATADGRLAGEPLSRNLGGSVGMEKRGATALLKSAAALDLAACGDGSVLDVMLHPSAVAGEEGADIIAGLVRAYCANGGAMIHFNVLNLEDLKKAQENPEKYGELQVRVCGWNSRFVDLSADEQAFFMKQAENAQ